MTNIQLAKMYVKKHPAMGNRPLARLMYEENKMRFGSLNSADCAVRECRGKLGKIPRHRAIVPVVEASLPEPEVFDYTPVFIEGAAEVAIFSDIHFPFHDKRALTVAVDEAVWRMCDTVIVNGDMLDCYQLSRFNRVPTVASMKKEIACASDFFAYLRRKLPRARIIWKLGNHEERLSAYLQTKASELWEMGVEKFVFEDKTGASDHGVELVSDKRIIVSGHLKILHGHEYKAGFAEPVNPARGLFLRAKTTCLAGHWHQPSHHSEPTLGGKHISCWSTGCLCHLSPPYMPLNKWRHGFAIQSVRADGTFHLHNLTIIDGEIA